MKIWHSSGSAKTVVGMNVGATVKNALYCGPVKIWPDNSSRWTKMEIELATGTEKNLDWAYWQHVCTQYSYRDIFSLGGWKNERKITTKIGGTTYNLLWSGMPTPKGTLTPNYNMKETSILTCSSKANVVWASGEGPLVTEVRAGDTLSLAITMPVLNLSERSMGFSLETQNGNATLYMNGWILIPGTKFQYDWIKGQKKVNSKMDFEIWHATNNTKTKNGLFVKGNGVTYGKWRNSLSGSNMYGDRIFGAAAGNVADGKVTEYHNTYVNGSNGMFFYVSLGGSASNASIRPIFPAFSRTIKFKVLSVGL